MKAIEKLHHAVTHAMFSYDDFDLEILKFVESRLDADDRGALRSQMDLINKAQTTFDEDTQVQSVMFYWMYMGKSRRDFPLTIHHSAETQSLMRLRIDVHDAAVILANVVMIKGVIFCIEYKSTTDIFRPLSPDFSISLAS